MNYSTINSRTILLPELGLNFHVDAIELPAELRELVTGQEEVDVANREMIEAKLSVLCQHIVGLPYVNVMAYSKWQAITNNILEVVGSEIFRKEILEVYGGSDPESRAT